MAAPWTCLTPRQKTARNIGRLEKSMFASLSDGRHARCWHSIRGELSRHQAQGFSKGYLVSASLKASIRTALDRVRGQNNQAIFPKHIAGDGRASTLSHLRLMHNRGSPGQSQPSAVDFGRIGILGRHQLLFLNPPESYLTT